MHAGFVYGPTRACKSWWDQVVLPSSSARAERSGNELTARAFPCIPHLWDSNTQQPLFERRKVVTEGH